MASPWKRVLLIASVILLIVGGLGIMSFRSPTVPFAPDDWARADRDRRGQMVASLLEDKRLPGLSMGEVEKALGKPDGSFESTQKHTVWIYRTGIKDALVDAPKSLKVVFDASGKVIDIHFSIH